MILNTDYCSGVFLSAEWFCPVAKWYIEDTALKFTRPDFWNSGFFADTPGKMGLLAVYTGTVFILSLPLSMIYILSVIIKRLSVR